jgi:transcriptional pleiotropic regulator of transition state genes
MDLKATGIVRKSDNMGRIVLPVELRRSLNISVKDSLEIYVDDTSIYLKKYEPSCVFCLEAKDTTFFNGKYVCKECFKEIKDLTTQL